MSSVALLSGGLDSTVATTAAHRRGRVVLALTADYGQRARTREIDAAVRVCTALRIAHRTVTLPFLREVGGNALTSPSLALPQLSMADIERGGEATAKSAAAVWVPNRNGILINVAAMFAESLQADEVVVGFNAEEAETFPDNSHAYLDAATRALEYSTANHVRVVSDTVDLDKVAIVKLGYELGAPLSCIWSCYRSERDPCWRCESCLRLRRALERARCWERFRDERAS